MSDKVLMKGNEAIAEAAIRCGCKYFFGYPITPQNELPEYMSKMLPKVGGTFIQAESEVAAINMVLGVAAVGERVMTSSSSPGISLKTEGISYMAGSDLPCLIVNMQRGGPGLGGIQPSQADYFQAVKAPGHGDFKCIVFAPATVQEMVDCTFEAFDLSDVYRMPAIMLGDGALGQMMEPVCLDYNGTDKKIDKLWACGNKDGKRRIVNSLYIDPEELESIVNERYKKYDEIMKKEVRYENYMTDDAEILIVAYGITARIAKSAIKMAREADIKVGLLRPITLWPFPEKEINELAGKVKKILTVELNMGQMVEDVKLAVNGKAPVEFAGRTGGIVITPDEVFEKIKEIGGNK